MEIEGNAYGRLRSSNDFREGVDSFVNKRKPDFTGS
jgi:2-oxoglutaroyl-CoA hydrolase